MVDSSYLFTNFKFSEPRFVIYISVHRSPNFLFNRKFHYPCNKRPPLVRIQSSGLRCTWMAGYFHTSYESKFVIDVQNKICVGRAVTGISQIMLWNKNRQIFGEVEMNMLQSPVMLFCCMELKRGD